MAYTTLAVVRAMEGMVGEETAFPDATISTAILWAEELIDEYTGTSWTAKAFASMTIDGSGSSRLILEDPYGQRRIIFPRSITTITVDGTDEISKVSAWALFPEGFVIRDEGTFTYTFPGRNVVIAGTAGATTAAPEDIGYAARTIARQYVLDTLTRVEDRAILLTTDVGTMRLSQPGAKYPTGMPNVDAILNRRRHRGPSVA